MVNRLAKDGLVEVVPNPQHTRSHLVRLTASGEARTRTLIDREAAVFAELGLEPSKSHLTEAGKVLAAIWPALSESALDEAVRRASSTET